MGELTISYGGVIALTVVFAVILLGLYALRSVGVFTLAKRVGVEKSWMAFIPFVWMWTMAKVTKINAFMGRKVKNFALIAVIIFSIAEVIALVQAILVYFPMLGYLLSGGEAYYFMGVVPAGALKDSLTQYMLDGSIYTTLKINIAYAYSYKMALALSIVDYVSLIFVLASIIIEVSVYATFARFYSPHHSFAVAFFSIIGFFPIIVFALRKKPRVEVKRSTSYGGFNPYGTPFNNPYGNPYNSNGENAPKDPGDPFDTKPSDDPFSEYSDKKDK